MNRLRRLACRIAGHAGPIRYRSRRGAVVWTGYACARCGLVLPFSSRPMDRRARRGERFGR